MLLTHAHVDHTGLFPKLALAGFRGKAWTTAATRDLLRWLLPDAGAIQENDVERLNRRNAAGESRAYRRSTPAPTPRHRSRCSPPAPYEDWFEPLAACGPGCAMPATSWAAPSSKWRSMPSRGPCAWSFPGTSARRKRRSSPIRSAGAPPTSLLLEFDLRRSIFAAAYRSPTPRLAGMRAERRLKAGGNVIVPVFAVERTQEILDDIAPPQARGTLAAVPVFLDSPLPAARPKSSVVIGAPSTRPTDGQSFLGGDFRLTETVEQSKAIGRIHGGAIVLAGSGMCDAGRVKHHLKDHLWRTI